jgi:Leucine-rich repeat (LRR) protein
MGNSSSAPGSSRPSSKAIIKSKLETAAKTGVLNLADANLKPSSSAYLHLWELAPLIKSLDLSGNTMKTLPAEMIYFTQLKNLHLSRCYIQRTRDISALPMVTTIRMDHNDFETTTLAPLPVSVTKLDLSSNHFVTFPQEAIGQLILLKDLKLSQNRLESIVGIEALLNLENLYLDDNKLTFLPEELGALVKLRTLSVKRNKITKKNEDGSQSIHPKVFTNTDLISIQLDENHLVLADVQSMDGVDIFIARRKEAKDKSFIGGATTDMTLFGLG